MGQLSAPSELSIPIKQADVLSTAWLTHALMPLTGGARVLQVEVVEVIRVMATKIRFIARWEGGGSAALCLKAFLDMDAQMARASVIGITEADFYSQIAPRLDMRLAACVTTLVDRTAGSGLIIMRDLIAEGAQFCTALEPFSLDQAAAGLTQLARLHAGGPLLKKAPWIGQRISELANADYVSTEVLQQLLDGERGEGLPTAVRDAGVLRTCLKELARRDALRPQTLIHGDCHAGNIFRSAQGPGLIDWQLFQRGGWSLDVAYHICAVLPVELAELGEWSLLDHYLQEAQRQGVELPPLQVARAEYRMAVVYGFYLWAITRRVEPHVIKSFVHRLGSAVVRHDSYRLLSA